MKLTNEQNLPPYLAAVISSDDYDAGDSDISATGLLQPPRKLALERINSNLLKEDMGDHARIVIGKAMHEYHALRSDGEFDDKRRLFMRANNWIVSGQPDHAHFENGKWVIGDIKTVGVYEYKMGIRSERERQLNIYAELFRANGMEVGRLELYLYFVDWNPARATWEKNYPPSSIMVVPVELWPREQAQEFISERVIAHQQAMEELPLCSNEDMWWEDKWSVMRDGNVKATKTFDNEQEALEFANEKGSGYYVEYRQGEPRRCRWYCTVGKTGLCRQYNNAKLNDGVQ